MDERTNIGQQTDRERDKQTGKNACIPRNGPGQTERREQRDENRIRHEFRPAEVKRQKSEQNAGRREGNSESHTCIHIFLEVCVHALHPPQPPPYHPQSNSVPHQILAAHSRNGSGGGELVLNPAEEAEFMFIGKAMAHKSDRGSELVPIARNLACLPDNVPLDVSVFPSSVSYRFVDGWCSRGNGEGKRTEVQLIIAVFVRRHT